MRTPAFLFLYSNATNLDTPCFYGIMFSNFLLILLFNWKDLIDFPFISSEIKASVIVTPRFDLYPEVMFYWKHLDLAFSLRLCHNSNTFDLVISTFIFQPCNLLLNIASRYFSGWYFSDLNAFREYLIKCN